MARATHSISYGRWYFEVEFLNQPGDAHIRIGWAQSHCKLIISTYLQFYRFQLLFKRVLDTPNFHTVGEV
jgi:hypothetical protein